MHKTWLSSMLNAAILKILMGQTNTHTHTHTHKTTTVTLAAHAHRGLIINVLKKNLPAAYTTFDYRSKVI